MVACFQMVQNPVACLLTATRKFSHITPVLKSLHWLTIHFQIHFQIILFVVKLLNNLAPPYLSELLHPYTQLRGDQSFAVS